MKMIIECEKCASKFSLDEILLKSSGSKVKCSMCKHVFTAYPTQQMSDEEPIPDKILDQDLEDTLPLDAANADFDLAFQRAVKESETEESVSKGILTEEGGDALKEESEMEPDEVETVSPKKRKGPSKILVLLLTIALLIAVGGTLLYMSLQNSSEKQESSDPGVMRLKFPPGSVTGSHVESNTAGPLFVIKGRVTNQYPNPRSYILLKGVIQDDKGKIVQTALAYAGNSFSEKEIRETPYAELKKRQEYRSGDEGVNVNIPTGETIPFMIVFEKLPENIAVFTVEAVSSDPGE
jgi:predicted Zn finger-like uncharacterized protein